MAKRRIHTEAEFDLAFVRDLKHRLRMMLREVEKAEKWLRKAATFERHAKAMTPEKSKAALQFYESLDLNTKGEEK